MAQIKISELAEEDILSKIKGLLGVGGVPGGVGIGDDCALIPHESAQASLVSADMLIEGTHFLLNERWPAKYVGKKAVIRNVSDIICKGGSARAALMTLALPPCLEASWLFSFLEGIRESASEFGLTIVGGDLGRCDGKFVASITIFGLVRPQEFISRSAAMPGDIIFVTGKLGASRAGLDILLSESDLSCITDQESQLIDNHFCPQLPVQFPKILNLHYAVHAAMDISDGLSKDLPRLLEASHVNAAIELTDIPLAKGVVEYCEARKIEPYSYAFSSGEEYQILGACDSGKFAEFQQNAAAENVEVTKIGTILAGRGQTMINFNGTPHELPGSAFEHFRPNNA